MPVERLSDAAALVASRTNRARTASTASPTRHVPIRHLRAVAVVPAVSIPITALVRTVSARADDAACHSWVVDAGSDDATWTHPAAQRRSSKIEGDGMFAVEDLRAGTVVARLRGHVVDDATLRELCADAATEGGYVDTIMIDDDQNLVLAPDQLIHFCNHSCDPTLWHWA